MRILHVIPGLTHERGGPSTVLAALVRHQAEQGHRVAVLTTDQGARHGERPVELPPAVPCERLAVVGPDRLAYAPGFARALRRRLPATDILHVHSVFTYPVHAALREAHAAGVPMVLRPCGHLHRYGLPRTAWHKWAYLALAGRLIRSACAAWHYTSSAESTESWPWTDKSGRTIVLPNGIEPEEYTVDADEAHARVKLTWPQLGGAPYVLFLGRLHPKKRLDLLLDAFLTAAPRPFKLAVAGPDEGNLWDRLGAQFACPDFSSRVVRLGMVSGADKVALLAGAALFALPSEHENFGNAALEALAAGTPVLLSPHVDLASTVVAAGFGEAVPLDPAAWRAALAGALANRQGRARGPRLRAWVEEAYAWVRLTAELTVRYQWVLAGCPRIEPQVPCAADPLARDVALS